MFEDPVKTKKYLKIALFGKGGTGKTRFALSFPKPCVIDAEHSTDPYREKYDFKVKHINKWMGLKEPISWLRAHPGAFETLVIDSATVFYSDLINEIIETAVKKGYPEMMNRGMWGIEKRRWAALCNVLTSLPMHVILTFREQDVYAEVPGKTGEEVLKKTGDQRMDADKQTEYLFDLAFHCVAEENKKAKSSRFLVRCSKTRYDWMPKYSEIDVTGKRAFDLVFAPHVKEMLDAPEAAAEAPPEPFVVPDIQDAKPAPEAAKEPALDERGAVERIGEALTMFQGDGGDAPPATQEEIKLLMTRCGQLAWPDGSKFKSADGKTLIKALYGLESTKDLRKYQCEFLYKEFGEVLSGRAALGRDEVGVPFVRPVSEASV